MDNLETTGIRERAKAEIEVFKAVLITTLTATFGVFGFIVIHYDKMVFLQWALIFVGSATLLGILLFCVQRIAVCLDQLERGV
ncbi:hypothetical protein [Helicobacter bizzozeronii]|uniref:hypothetical protein n=1 Tax=Helicobacter bizzozeronii TaxID=56877 RepID=UPI000CF04DC5|nr:hypothetical protein [Helicobacter bizzozeronii]